MALILPPLCFFYEYHDLPPGISILSLKVLMGIPGFWFYIRESLALPYFDPLLYDLLRDHPVYTPIN